MSQFVKFFSLLLLSAGIVCGQQAPESTTDAPAAAEAPIAPTAPEEPLEPVWEDVPARGNPMMSRTVFGQHIVIRTNESIRELVLIGGSADIQGEVERDVVAVGGSVKLSGTVGGDMVIVGGKGTISGRVDRDTVIVLGAAEVADSAVLDNDAVFVGGPFDIAPGATIGGERVTVPFGNFLPQIEWLKSYFVRGPLLGRWLTFHLAWPWVVAGTFLAVYLATLLVFPAAARAVYTSLEERPVTSIFTGLLTLILFAPLMFLLIVSVIGILVIPFLKIALILAVLFGKVGVICFLGRGMGKTTGATSLQAPLFAFLIGAIILTLTYAIPLFGIFAWAMATVFGLGGAIVALTNTFKKEEANVPPAPVMVSNLRPADPAGGMVPRASEPIPAASSTTTAGPSPAPPITPASIANLSPQDSVLLPRAGFWKRFLAALLDLLLLSLTVFILPVIGLALFLPLAVVYFIAMWTWRGTTIGGLVFGHKIVRTDGRRINLSVAVVRSLLSLFSVVTILGFLWAAWDREKQTWHDKIAGTVVVRMPEGFSLL